MRTASFLGASILVCSMQIALGAQAATPAAPATSVPGFSTSATSPYMASTIKQFITDCDIDQASCAAMIGNVLMDRIQFSPTSHICIPSIKYGDAVVPWLKVHPEMASMGVQDGVFEALTVIYKCGPPNNY